MPTMIAAVQAAYVLMDQQATLAKALDLIRQAAASGRADHRPAGGVHPGHPDLDRHRADLGR